MIGRSQPPTPPIEPPTTAWRFPRVRPSAGDLVGAGADLEPGTLLAAYRRGLFPMHVQDGPTAPTLGWWSPEPRGILPLDGLRVTRSLRQACRRFRSSTDEAFEAVIDGCADADRPGKWINDEIRAAYVRLHELGWAHSVETWDGDTLVGGLYGVSIGGLFAGESMFHRATDASKAALVHLVDVLRRGRAVLLDVQWVTPHLASLGAIEIPRSEYFELVADAVALDVHPFSPGAGWDPPA